MAAGTAQTGQGALFSPIAPPHCSMLAVPTKTALPRSLQAPAASTSFWGRVLHAACCWVRQGRRQGPGPRRRSRWAWLQALRWGLRKLLRCALRCCAVRPWEAGCAVERGAWAAARSGACEAPAHAHCPGGPRHHALKSQPCMAPSTNAHLMPPSRGRAWAAAARTASRPTTVSFQRCGWGGTASTACRRSTTARQLAAAAAPGWSCHSTLAALCAQACLGAAASFLTMHA